MMSAERGPSSIVLLSTHILRIRIDDAQAGQWATAPDGWLQRSVQLSITLLEVLKGSVAAQPDDSLSLRVRQRASPSPRGPTAPGVWSNQPIDPETELLSFSRGQDNAAVAGLLSEGICQQIVTAEGTLPDVRLILQAEAAGMDPLVLLEFAAKRASTIGYLFTEYLWAKLARPMLADVKTFEALMRFIERPDLSLIARWALLQSVYAEVAHSTTLAPEYADRLAVSMLRLLEVARDASVTDNIVQVFLPNLLGLQGGLPKHSAAGVFQAYADERPKIEQALREYRGNASTAQLLEWLRQGA